jgi:hypothetical protein
MRTPATIMIAFSRIMNVVTHRIIGPTAIVIAIKHVITKLLITPYS